MAWYGMVGWHGRGGMVVVWHGMGMPWHGRDMAWHGRGMAWHGRGMVWHGMVGIYHSAHIIDMCYLIFNVYVRSYTLGAV